ncbi:MAG: LytR C-terminal domain-containing protein [Candidatus Sabulitectum sp.]|nr:LytR C-terminal domain-containing protein [Candidatus Sabulitectum sp.]
MSKVSTRQKKKKNSKKKSVIPVILISLAAGCLITLSVIYSPSWFQTELIPIHLLSDFHLNDSTPPPDTIRIEVRNGTGVSDLAGRAQSFLETRGGDVTFYAPGPPLNAGDMDYAVTVIVSHDASFSAAIKVADVIGVGDSSIVMLLPPPGEIAPVDVTVILGRDRDDPSYFIPYRD